MGGRAGHGATARPACPRHPQSNNLKIILDIALVYVPNSPMSSPSPTAPPAPRDPARPACDNDTQFHTDALNELVAMGMDIARTLHQQALAQPTDDTPTPDLTTPFERIARTVRRTICLAQHIAQQVANPRPVRAAPAAPDRAQARKQILRRVEDVIVRTRSGPAAHAAHAELLDRLDSLDLAEDLDHDIATRPVPEIIAEITQDLGLLSDGGHPYYRRRTPADIHRLTLRAHGHRIPEPPQAQPPQTQPPQVEPRRTEPPPHEPPLASTRPPGPASGVLLPPLKPPPSLAALAAKLLDA